MKSTANSEPVMKYSTVPSAEVVRSRRWISKSSSAVVSGRPSRNDKARSRHAMRNQTAK